MSPREYRFSELRLRAEEAKLAYTANGETSSGLGPHSIFFPPPVCDKADLRMLGTIEASFRRGNSLYHEDREFPFAEITTRLVFGLNRWLSETPPLTISRVIIKNPRSVSGVDLHNTLGIKNALVVSGTRGFLGGITRFGVYVVRPVVEQYQREMAEWYNSHYGQ